MKKLLLMMCVMLIPLSGWAQDSEPYVGPYSLFTPATGTLTFMYGELTETAENKYYSQGLGVVRYWGNGTIDSDNVTKVVFDSSCKTYYPTSLYLSYSNMTEIVGIQNLNTSKITSMNSMFAGCKCLTSIDLSHFDTSAVTEMRGMFMWSGVTNLDLSSFDTSHVKDMSSMFYCCSSSNIDLSSFNTKNVTNMFKMFGSCQVTDLDLSNFDTSNVTDMSGMFEHCGGLRNLNISSFNTANVTTMHGMFYDCFSLPSLDLSSFNTEKVTDMSSMFFFCESLSSLDLSSFNTANVTNMSDMFYMNSLRNPKSCLKSINLSSFNTANVTDMSMMFAGCSSLTSLDLSSFDITNADIHGMFYRCSSLTSLDLSSFNTSNVTDMSFLFSDCSGLTSLDVSHFDTSNVTNMLAMFQGCSGLTNLNVSHFSTKNVTNMGNMFGGCSGLTSIDITNFNTSKVTDMSSMFRLCSSLTCLDLSNLCTAQITDMKGMFRGCSQLKTIYCNDTWPEGHENMFTGCESIKGYHGTTYSAKNTSSAYAHPSSGGYFTRNLFTFVTVIIGSKTQYWSSFYTDTRNVKADENTTVYTATLSSDGKELTLNEIADKIIPCGQAVLMKSTVKEPMLVTASSEGTGDYSTNSLQGTQVDIPTSSVEGTVYTLANSTEFGFYKYTGETLKGGKAFLVVSGGSLARITIAGLDDDATGIERIGTDESQAPSYDLQGRRVSQTQKGVYIINGKKVVK